MDKFVGILISLFMALIVLIAMNAIFGIIDFHVFSNVFNDTLEINIEEFEFPPKYVAYMAVREFAVMFVVGFLSIVFFSKDLLIRGVGVAIGCGVWGGVFLDVDSNLIKLVLVAYYMACAFIGVVAAKRWKARTLKAEKIA